MRKLLLRDKTGVDDTREPGPDLANDGGVSEKGAPAVERALRILEMLASSRKGMTLAEIARNLQANRSSVYYIVRTMEACGYLTRTAARGRYSYTSKLFELANRTLVGVGLREAAAPILRALADRVGMTVHMAVLLQYEIVLIHKVSPVGRPAVATWVGKRLPIHCTSAGKALMAYMPEAHVDEIIRRGLIRYNDYTIVSGARLKKELAKARAQGFAMDDEEETLGLRCIGAPIFQHGSAAIAAISIAGSTSEIHDGNLDGLVRQVCDAASAITAALAGGHPPVEQIGRAQ